MVILCVTPNPAIDRTLIVPGFAAGGVWRAVRADAGCGGKGVNVARTLRRLHRSGRCMGPLGGHAGRHLAEAAAAEGLAARWTAICAETRSCVIVAEDGGRTTVINEPGPQLTGGEWSNFIADIQAEAQSAEAVCISGSLPSGGAPDDMAQLIAAAASVPELWVDSSGAALDAAVAAAAPGIKINAEEASLLLGGRLQGRDDAAAAARAIRSRGPRRVVVTLGAAGAVLADGDGCWFAAPPTLAAVNPVGSGDSFLAGLVARRTEGRTPPDALRLAVACGAANALSERAGEIDPGCLQRLSEAVRVERI